MDERVVDRLPVGAPVAEPLALCWEEGPSRNPDQPDLGEMTATAILPLPGAMHLDRSSGRVLFRSPEPPPFDVLLHPALGTCAVVFATWAGHLPLHAGCFALDGAAWAVIGPRGAGKTTLLAALAAAGVDIVADDATIVRDGFVPRGPRTLDLRPEAAHLARGSRSTSARLEQRHRIELPAATGGLLPLAGCLILRTGDEIVARPVRPSDRLELLAGAAFTLEQMGPAALLRLAQLRTFEIVRPLDWRRLDEVVALVRSLTP